MMESPYLRPIEFYERLSSDQDSSVDALVNFFLFEGVPYALSDWEEYCSFRRELSDRLDVNAKSIVTVGSGRMGYSLSPNEKKQKLWKPFGDHSDFDVVVVDHRKFDRAWDEILKADDKQVNRFQFNAARQRWRNLYDGMIDVNYLADEITFVEQWQTAFAEISAIEWNGQPRTTKGFLFRDWTHAQRHYRKSFEQILRSVKLGRLPAPPNGGP